MVLIFAGSVGIKSLFIYQIVNKNICFMVICTFLIIFHTLCERFYIILSRTALNIVRCRSSVILLLLKILSILVANVASVGYILIHNSKYELMLCQ